MVVLSRRHGLGDWAWGVAPLIWNVFLRAAHYMGYGKVLALRGWQLATLENATKGGLGGGNIRHLYGIGKWRWNAKLYIAF
eukprot:scaffold139727_cov76-Cyclotella_meneghiniana.AAC.1